MQKFQKCATEMWNVCLSPLMDMFKKASAATVTIMARAKGDTTPGTTSSMGHDVGSSGSE